MSLFPAYANAKFKDDEIPSSSNAPWLTNSSFRVNTDIINKPRDVSGSVSTRGVKRNRKEKNKLKEKKVESKKPLQITSDLFSIDLKGCKEFFKVDTIYRPSVPRYEKKYTIFVNYKSHKKFKRYFKVKIDEDNSEEVNNKQAENENFKVFKEEDDMKQITATLNRKLTENPQDVDTWLEYSRFQDSVYQFEKTRRKGSIVKGLRVTAERKLAILDKALTHLPNNERLLRERLNICVGVYPSDELYVNLSKLIDKEQGNIILWQGYIESRQCSMSHCNTATVINLYVKCLSTLHQLRRTAKLEKSVLEENILRMLYQCGLFLKQSGLFELLWTLLKMYLELNLSQEKNKFNLSCNFVDKQLIELEEVVLKSQLPLHELWLRIEKLRESCHWLPHTGEGDCEDPQRLVFSEDVAELIHPITMPGNTFKLTATILSLLKVPLLPCRHTTMKNLGLDYVPWALDSIETILPIFLTLYPIDLTNQKFFNYLQKLAIGPQYLKSFPGQEEYLLFVLEIMFNSIDCLKGDEKTALSVWWFRFQRILYTLEKNDLIKMSKNTTKNLRAQRKSLLKNESSNVVLYEAFALIEQDLGNHESCVNVLLTAIRMNPIQKTSTEDTKSSTCSLYKTLAELYLDKSTPLYNTTKSTEYLIKLALNTEIDEAVTINEVILDEAHIKFKHTTLKLLQNDLNKIETVQHFLPQFLTNWIICNGWYIYLTKGVMECSKFIEEVSSSLPEKDQGSWEKEILHEFHVAVLFKSRTENTNIQVIHKLGDVLLKSIELYPNNIFFLSALAKEQSISSAMGQHFWKIKNLLMATGHSLPNLFLILIIFQRTREVEENWIDTFTGDHITSDVCLRNRTLSLFRTLTGPTMCTRRCGLIWRLYLQFLHENFYPDLCRKAYYSAVEECPWLKALYIDAAIYVPSDLPQIQDLLIEKQLRLHVTPDELDILRN